MNIRLDGKWKREENRIYTVDHELLICERQFCTAGGNKILDAIVAEHNASLEKVVIYFSLYNIFREFCIFALGVAIILLIVLATSLIWELFGL